MNSIEQYQHHLKRQNEVIVASASDLAKHIQAIATAQADYAKRSFKDGKAGGCQIARRSDGSTH